jgi:hypothetical protein
VCSDQALAAYSPTSPRGTAPDALLSIGSSLSSIDAQGVSWRFWQFVPVPQRFLPLALRACTHGHTPAFNNVLLRSRYDALIFRDTAALAMPDTVVRWQRERFRRFWAGLSKLPCRT